MSPDEIEKLVEGALENNNKVTDEFTMMLSSNNDGTVQLVVVNVTRKEVSVIMTLQISTAVVLRNVINEALLAMEKKN